MSQEEFNPHNEKYKKLSDLPIEQQDNFVAVDENGFITKDAFKELSEAQVESEFRKTFSNKTETSVDILHERALDQNEKDTKSIKDALILDYSKLTDAPRDIQFDLEFVQNLIELSKGDALQYVPKELRSNRDFVLDLIERRTHRPNGYGWSEPLLEYLPENICKDKEIVLEIVKTNHDQFQYISEELQSNREFVLEAVRTSPLVVGHLTENFRNDREVIIEAVKNDRSYFGLAFSHASEELRSDPEFVLEATKFSKGNIRPASEELRSNREFMLSIFKQKSLEPFRQTLMVHPPAAAFRYASEELRSDREFVLETIKTGILEHDVLNYIPESLLNDKEIITESTRRDARTNWPSSFGLASEELRSNREFVLEIVKTNHRAFQYVSKDLQADREIVLEVIKREHEASSQSGVFHYISKELLSDPYFALEAGRLDPKIGYYLTGKAKELYDEASRS